MVYLIGRVSGVDYSLGPMICIATVLGPDNVLAMGFILVPGAFSPSRKWFVTLMTSTPPLHQWACIARPIVIDICRVHIWISLDSSSPLVACVAPPRTRNVSQ